MLRIWDYFQRTWVHEEGCYRTIMHIFVMGTKQTSYSTHLWCIIQIQGASQHHEQFRVQNVQIIFSSFARQKLYVNIWFDMQVYVFRCTIFWIILKNYRAWLNWFMLKVHPSNMLQPVCLFIPRPHTFKYQDHKTHFRNDK